MKKIILLLAVLSSSVLFASASSKAEPTPVVSLALAQEIQGCVLDRKTNEPLAGALLIVNDQKYYTDFDGKFKISNQNLSESILKITMISYFEEEFKLDLSKKEELKIQLNQR